MRKSVGAETTFDVDLEDFGALRDALQPIIDKVWRHCETQGVRGRTVTLKVKYSDFSLISRSRSEMSPIASRERLEAASIELLRKFMPLPLRIRLLGISLSSLEARTAESWPSLFAVQ